jgi:hypothetical protein
MKYFGETDKIEVDEFINTLLNEFPDVIDFNLQ